MDRYHQQHKSMSKSMSNHQEKVNFFLAMLLILGIVFLFIFPFLLDINDYLTSS